MRLKVLSVISGIAGVAIGYLSFSDDLDLFLSTYAKNQDARLNIEKFDLLKNYSDQILNIRSRDSVECIPFGTNRFQMIKSPLVNQGSNQLEFIEVNFTKRRVRQINKGINSKKYFSVSDILHINDSLGFLGIEYSNGSSLSLIKKNTSGNWIGYCELSSAVYD